MVHRRLREKPFAVVQKRHPYYCEGLCHHKREEWALPISHIYSVVLKEMTHDREAVELPIGISVPIQYIEVVDTRGGGKLQRLRKVLRSDTRCDGGEALGADWATAGQSGVELEHPPDLLSCPDCAILSTAAASSR